jgi:hypothetical protein
MLTISYFDYGTGDDHWIGAHEFASVWVWVFNYSIYYMVSYLWIKCLLIIIWLGFETFLLFVLFFWMASLLCVWYLICSKKPFKGKISVSLNSEFYLEIEFIMRFFSWSMYELNTNRV